MMFKGIVLSSNRAQIRQMSQNLNGRKTDTHKHSRTDTHIHRQTQTHTHRQIHTNTHRQIQTLTDNIVITEILCYFLKKGKWTEEE
jgi:hypothetical protein